MLVKDRSIQKGVQTWKTPAFHGCSAVFELKDRIEPGRVRIELPTLFPMLACKSAIVSLLIVPLLK